MQKLIREDPWDPCKSAFYSLSFLASLRRGVDPRLLGESDREGDAAGGRRFDLDAAAVEGDDSPRFREAEAEAAAGFSARIEGIEDVGADFRGDAWAVVRHDDLHPRRFFLLHGDADGAAMADGVGGVIE